MKRQTFYPTIWSPMPFNFGFLAQGNRNSTPTKEVILTNDMLSELKVSELDLNITKITALDTNGEEHQITEFKQASPISIKGMASGHYLRSSQLLNLNPGTFSKLRFYITQENKFTYNDGLVEDIFSYQMLDFEIENGLAVESNGAKEVKLWFDLVPLNPRTYIKRWGGFFSRNQNLAPQLP